MAKQVQYDRRCIVGKSGGERKRYSRESTTARDNIFKQMGAYVRGMVEQGGCCWPIRGGGWSTRVVRKGLTGFRAGLNLTIFQSGVWGLGSGDSGFGMSMALREDETSRVRSWEVGAGE